jgi:ABC-type sugar transport system ATPase subunit
MTSANPALSTASPTALYEATAIAKHFGGTQALKGVTVAFRTGEVHAIVGENGAGKSTLIKILCGVYPAGQYEGELSLDGHVLRIDGIRSAEAHGIFLVPQDLQIVPDLSIAENLFLNREPSNFGLIDVDAMLSETTAWLKQFRLDLDPDTRMGGLMPAQQQLVVIARAMMRGVRVLALDEPTAALTDSEAQVLFQHIEELRAKGIAIIYISHRLDEITLIANVITVLRDGLIADYLERGAVQETARRVVRAMIGRDVNLDMRHAAKLGKERLSVKSLTITAARERALVKDLSFGVRAGEVVGFFGALGCGSDYLVRALLGTIGRPSSGEIKINGQATKIGRPADALKMGMGYLPGDRQRDAMFPQLTIAQNIGILTLDRVTRAGFVAPGVEIPLVQNFFDRFRIKAPSIDARISTLSGGNQQKTMLARVLSRDPAILILHEPAQGVDIGTKQELYALIDRLAQEGKAILVVSSDLEEVLVTCDRIIVMRHGRAVGSWDRVQANKHDILAAATGGH